MRSLLLSLLLLCGSAVAAPPVVDPGFEAPAATSPRGPQTIVRALLDDPSGGLWIGGFQGLTRFDGERFTSVTLEAGLARARVFALLRDRDGRVWVGTMGGGVYRFDGRTWTRFTTADGLAGDRVLALAQTADGAIWIGHEGAGATRFDGERFTTFGAAEGLTDGDVSSVSQDGTGRIWLGSRDGLFHYDGAAFVNFSAAHGLITGGYVPTLVDARGELWFAGQNGLNHTDGETVHRVVPHEGWALFEAADGVVWFHGAGRFHRITLQNGKLFAARVVPGAPAEGLVFTALQDHEGRIWTGSLSGVGQVDGS